METSAITPYLETAITSFLGSVGALGPLHIEPIALRLEKYQVKEEEIGDGGKLVKAITVHFLYM